MNVDIERALKSLRKVRKAMKDLSGDTSPEQVHALRTQARRVEAIVHALSPAGTGARKLAKAVKPVRRAAGKARDMDVLMAKLLELSSPREEDTQEALVRLGEHLAGVRQRH